MADFVRRLQVIQEQLHGLFKSCSNSVQIQLFKFCSSLVQKLFKCISPNFVQFLSIFLWIFFSQTVEGVKGKLMRCHRASDSEYSPSYLPFSEEMPSIVCVCTTQGNTTRAFLCVFEIFWAQRIEDVKSLKM